jgi:hypothetical protein
VLHANTDAIVALRLQIWDLEHSVNGKRRPLRDWSSAQSSPTNSRISSPVQDVENWQQPAGEPSAT